MVIVQLSYFSIDLHNLRQGDYVSVAFSVCVSVCKNFKVILMIFKKYSSFTIAIFIDSQE